MDWRGFLLFCFLLCFSSVTASLLLDPLVNRYHTSGDMKVGAQTSTEVLEVRSEARISGSVVIEGNISTHGSETTLGNRGSLRALVSPSSREPAQPGQVFSFIEGVLLPGAIYGRGERSYAEFEGDNGGDSLELVEFDDELSVILHGDSSDLWAVPVKIKRNEVVWRGHQKLLLKGKEGYHYSACRGSNKEFVVLYTDYNKDMHGMVCEVFDEEIVSYGWRHLMSFDDYIQTVQSMSLDPWNGTPLFTFVVSFVWCDDGFMMTAHVEDGAVQVDKNYSINVGTVERNGLHLYEYEDTRAFGIVGHHDDAHLLIGKINHPDIAFSQVYSLGVELEGYASGSPGRDGVDVIMNIEYFVESGAHHVVATLDFDSLSATFGPENALLPGSITSIAPADGLNFIVFQYVSSDPSGYSLYYCEVDGSTKVSSCGMRVADVNPFVAFYLRSLHSTHVMILGSTPQSINVFVTSQNLIRNGIGGTQSASLIGCTTTSANPGYMCGLELCGVVSGISQHLEPGKSYYASPFDSDLTSQPSELFRYEVGKADTDHSLVVNCRTRGD